MPDFIPLQFTKLPLSDQTRNAGQFYQLCNGRRSVRDFSSDPIPAELIETLIKTAGTAPSGANRQPWRFIVVQDPELKRKIRIAAEKEEKESYEERMPDQWLEDLSALGTDWHKEFLETAPVLIVVFAVNYEPEEKRIHKNYYVRESVGVAVGFLLAAIHHAGLVALTHTPSPMNFLQEILERPQQEKPYLLIPVGYPAPGALVPDIHRKPLHDILLWR